MAAQHVVGASPVTFIREDPATAGQQVSIPLSSLKFDANGAIDASGWPPVQSHLIDHVDRTKYGTTRGRKLSAAERKKLGAAESRKLHAAEGNKLGAVDSGMLKILLRNMVALKHLSSR